MIAELDRALATLLELELPEHVTSAAQISFEAPDRAFATSGVPLPAIDLFLYDVRENGELRDRSWMTERPEQGNVIRHPPPARVDCSYLVTAWPSTSSPRPVEDEHRLLSEVMRVLLATPTLPATVLDGDLLAQQPRPPALALGSGRLTSISEFWQALGGKPKAALHLTVTIAVTTAAPVDAGAPVREHVVEMAQGATRRETR